jgi:hypothetical protein
MIAVKIAPGRRTAMSDLFAEDEEEQHVDHNGKVTEAKKYDSC